MDGPGPALIAWQPRIEGNRPVLDSEPPALARGVAIIATEVIGPNLHVGPGMPLHCLEAFGKAGLKRLADVVVAKISYQPLDRVPNNRVR